MFENQVVDTDSATQGKENPRSQLKRRRLHGGDDAIDSILLRLSLIREAAGNGSYVLGVTSCQRYAGVSTIVGKMAMRAAQMSLGEILLIDANLDHPKQAYQFGLKQKEGFADALLGDGEILGRVFNGAVDGLHVMPAGVPFMGNVGVSPDVCAALVRELRQDFAWVFIDLPPISDSARFLLFSRQTDGLALVVDAKASRARRVERALQVLEGSGTSIVGTILNRMTRTLPRWLDRWV